MAPGPTPASPARAQGQAEAKVGATDHSSPAIGKSRRKQERPSGQHQGAELVEEATKRHGNGHGLLPWLSLLLQQLAHKSPGHRSQNGFNHNKHRDQAGNGLPLTSQLTEQQHNHQSREQKTEAAHQAPQGAVTEPSQNHDHLTGGGSGQGFAQGSTLGKGLGCSPTGVAGPPDPSSGPCRPGDPQNPASQCPRTPG